MATCARLQPGFNPLNHSTAGKARSVLGGLPLGNIQNIRQTVESLAVQLENFHIHGSDSAKENKPRPPIGAGTSRITAKLQDAKDALDDSFRASSGAVIPTGPEKFENNNALAQASKQLPSNQEQLAKHQEGRFEWLLSIALDRSANRPNAFDGSRDDAELRRGDKKVYFGCNLVHSGPKSGGVIGNDGKSANVYTLLATRIEGGEELAMENLTDDEFAREWAEGEVEHMRLFAEYEKELAMKRAGAAERESMAASQFHQGNDTKGDDTPEQLIVPQPQPSRPMSRIEDSVEALDKLEDEIEALAEVAHLDRVLSPETTKLRTQAIDGARAKSTTLKRAVSVRTSPGTPRGKGLERSSSARKPVASPNKEGENGPSPGASNTSARTVPRPASLLPPKPPAKSSKPPTVPTFELPGEAVSRRLREQREARRSQQITPEQAAALAAANSPATPHFKSSKPPTVPIFELPGEAESRRLREESQERRERRSQQIAPEQAAALAAANSPATPHFKSPKPPTRPTFELPGEAISRKKREAREAKLRAQEEEERKRREFKARPIPASLVPSLVPRETLASRARQNKQRQAEGSADSASGAHGTQTAASKKRQSMAVASSPHSSSTATLPTRGRGNVTDSAPHAHQATSRGTSTSTGSTHSGGSGGKRSAVSAEEAAQQKLRGKEILSRDNSYRAERERERRERENAAKLARQEAAERSRQLSREWAEKQRLKREREREKGLGQKEAAEA